MQSTFVSTAIHEQDIAGPAGHTEKLADPTQVRELTLAWLRERCLAWRFVGEVLWASGIF